MTVKKSYTVGDTVWIFGIDRPNKPTKGQIVKAFEIDGYLGIHYVVAIPTHIEDLLEIRTWENISQDKHGPIGMFREIKDTINPTNKLLRKTGLEFDDYYSDEDEPSQEQIVAALNNSQKASEHPPLILKPLGQKRRRYGRKKKPL